MTTIEVRRQFYAAISANIIGFSFGWSVSWANANFIHFLSNESSLGSGAMTKNEASLFMSLICAGGLGGNLIYLWVLSKFGRKMPILFLALPSMISWILILYAKNVYWLYASRVLCGFVGGATFISVPIFVSEICSDNVRGIMNALGFLIVSLGSLMGFIVAIYFDFRMQAACAIAIPIIFVSTFSFVPESPAFLLRNNRNGLAILSSNYYKEPNPTEESEKITNITQCEKDEIETFDELLTNVSDKNQQDKSADQSQQLYKELIPPSKHKESAEQSSTTMISRIRSLRDRIKTRAARRAIYISLMLVILPQFCGCFILISYSTAYFAEAGSSLTPLQSSILICIVQLIANLVTIFLIERLGRKILFTTSSIGTGLGLIVLALHNVYKHELPGTNWVPIYGLSITIFIATTGLLTIPFIITVDVLPLNIREITMTVTAMSMWILGFATNAAYLCLLDIIHLYGCLLVFSIGCFCCALYAIIFIPETKGKSYESIAKLLERR